MPGAARSLGLLGGLGQELGLEVLGAGGAQLGAGDRLGEVAGVGAGVGELAAVGGEVGVEDGPGLAEGGDGREGAGAQAVAGRCGRAGLALGGGGAEAAGAVRAGGLGAGRLAAEVGMVGQGEVLGGGAEDSLAHSRIKC